MQTTDPVPSGGWRLRRMCDCLPKFSQGFFRTGFRRTILLPEMAPFLVRFWSVSARRAAALLCLEGLAPGPRFGACPGLCFAPVA